MDNPKSRIRTRIYESSDWLSPERMAAWIQPGHPDGLKTLAAWREEGRILAVDHEGVDLYPRFAVSPAHGYLLCPALAQVIQSFRPRRSDWGIAVWLVCGNTYLNSAEPQDLLWSAPSRVVLAAQEQALGIRHG
jgi:hypothetical protein